MGRRPSGDYDPTALVRAASIVGRALTLDPKLTEAHVVRAWIFLFQDDLAGAKSAARKAAQLDEADTRVRALFAEIAAREGR